MGTRTATDPSEEFLDQLRAIIGDRIVLTESVRDSHGRDESAFAPAAPNAVAFPESTKDVAALVKVCARARVPVIPFGAGTSLEGNVLATSGGVSIDLTRMNEIVEVNVADLDVSVQPGVTRSQLEVRLKREGLFFPVDPGADATIGGMASTGASGTTTVMYGAMRENILSLEVVLADGRVIRTGHRARKSSAGYDLTRLFVGSEGTLGIITEVTLRVQGIPEAIAGAVGRFSSVEDAVSAVISIMQLGIKVARIEYLDEKAMTAVNDYSGLSYAAAPTLFLEFHGSESGVVEQSQAAREVALEHGADDFDSAFDHQARAKLWRARHDAYFATLALRPGARALTTDVCVPISRLAECMVETRRDVDSTSLIATTVGHVGDGNFHLLMLFDPANEAERREAAEVNRRLIERALRMEGTCTGEHGVGLGKMASLSEEMGEAVDVMRELKRALDPNNLMNPGKVVSTG
jgi:D-lactate dehydrogenase (cytochrome)